MPSSIQKNVLLGAYTTLGVGGTADFFAEISSVETLTEVVEWAQAEKCPITILGGGSNVLVPDTGFKGLVIRMNIVHCDIVDIFDAYEVTAGAGMILDTLVATVVDRGIWGLENLSGIPGTVGAVPIQNVGAYGVEVEESIHEVTVFDMATRTVRTLSKEACMFGYRDSYFKKEGSESLIIIAVTFQFSKGNTPRLTYADLKTYFGDRVPTLQEVRAAILEIRSRKFPDWSVIGTAGSFFKNPIITQQTFDTLRSIYPDVPGHRDGDSVKINLGWILDHVCHLRGHCEGSVCLYEKQALVLVCKKGTSADAIIQFSNRVIEKVFLATGIVVEREVTILK